MRIISPFKDYFGQHVAEKDVPKIDDKTLAEAKGFDKHSFRREKR